MIDEKNLQSEKLDDEELEKVSGGQSGEVSGENCKFVNSNIIDKYERFIDYEDGGH